MTLEKVAKRAGVSTATVSRVLNNVDVVRSATRSRVMRAVTELNYHPNLHARNLAGGRSRTIGMIASNLENPYFFDVFRSLEAVAHSKGYEVIVTHTGYSAEQLVKHVRLMIGRRVAGLAVMVSEMDPSLLRELTESGIPAVFSDVGTPAPTITNLRTNYRRGIEKIVEYLHDLGHKRLAFAGHHSSLGSLGERERAFVESVERFAPEARWRTVANEDGLAGGRAAARELLATGFRPTAIICVNDFMAAGVLAELRRQGLRVPADVSVTGFDNIQLSEYTDPPLTTVHLPRERIGQIVFESLMAGPEAAAAGREVLIDVEFVLRESTGRAPAAEGANG